MQIKKTLGAMMVGGVLALTTHASIAAESAAGVMEHFGMLIKTTQEALDAAKSGNEPACRDNIKMAKQHYKEITGDAAGKSLQDAMKRIKEAQAACEKEGGAAQAAQILGEVVPTLQKLKGK